MGNRGKQQRSGPERFSNFVHTCTLAMPGAYQNRLFFIRFVQY